MTFKLPFYFSLFTFYFLCAPAASAQSTDWPQFRGPDGQGHSTETNLPLEWSETKNVAWKTAIRGRGWSSPVVADGRVWVTTSVEQARSASLRALAFDVESGREIVNVEVFRLSNATLKNPKNSNASPTPIVEGNRVYLHFGADGTAAIDAATGAVVWKAQFPYESQHGAGGSPALYKDLLIFSGDGHYEAWVVALDKNTGKVRWKTERRKPFAQAYTTPLVISVGGRDQVVSVGAFRAEAYNPETGKEIWYVRYEDGFSNVPTAGVRARPRVHHDRIFRARGPGGPGRWNGRRHVDAQGLVDLARCPLHTLAHSRRRRAVHRQRSRHPLVRRCEDGQGALAATAGGQSFGVTDFRRRPSLLSQ